MNRGVLALLGTVLLGAGAFGLARGFGWLGEDARSEAVVGAEMRRRAGDAGWVSPTVAAAVALVVAYLAWRWLRAQLRTAPTLAEAELPAPDPDEPATRVRVGAILDAVTADVERHPEVVAAGGRLGPEAEPFALHVDVTVADGARVEEVRDHFDAVVVPRLRQAVEADELVAHLRFDTSSGHRVA